MGYNGVYKRYGVKKYGTEYSSEYKSKSEIDIAVKHLM